MEDEKNPLASKGADIKNSALERQQRHAQALRLNLKKRKQQLKDRKAICTPLQNGPTSINTDKSD